MSRGLCRNLLFIYTDEQRFDTLGAYGNNYIQMPGLNKLAGKSTVFERAYVTQPVCGPSRSSLLTGLYPHTSGCVKNNIPLSRGKKCLPEMLKNRDYATAHFGKWHLGDEIYPQHGFNHWRSIEDQYSKYYGPGRNKGDRSSYHHFLLDNGIRPANGSMFSRRECARMPEKFGKPSYVAGEACRFIRENSDTPFVLYVNFLEPHMPFCGPRDGQYPADEIPLPGNFNDPPGPRHHPKTRLLSRAIKEKGFGNFKLKTEKGWRKLIANYLGLCSLVDTHAGRILETLEECGLEEETIVVFTSDHGDMMGSHRLLAKCVMFEEAVRVPLLFKIPGIPGGRKIPVPVSQIDIVPTLLDLLGEEIPVHLQGKSLKSLLPRENAGKPEDVFIEWNGDDGSIPPDSLSGVGLPGKTPSCAKGSCPGGLLPFSDPVRTVITHDGWKFSKSASGWDELFNLNDDPLENKNLAGCEGYRKVEKELTERIDNWRGRTNDG